MTLRVVGLYLILLILAACKKETAGAEPPPATTTETDGTAGFTSYLIKAGNNYCEHNGYPLPTLTECSFKAIFDSSAIYANADAANQYDINKLYGFSDSMTQHHQNSARFGWNWYGNALHIHTYTYVHGVGHYRELGTVR